MVLSEFHIHTHMLFIFQSKSICTNTTKKQSENKQISKTYKEAPRSVICGSVLGDD